MTGVSEAVKQARLQITTELEQLDQQITQLCGNAIRAGVINGLIDSFPKASVDALVERKSFVFKEILWSLSSFDDLRRCLDNATMQAIRKSLDLSNEDLLRGYFDESLPSCVLERWKSRVDDPVFLLAAVEICQRNRINPQPQWLVDALFAWACNQKTAPLKRAKGLVKDIEVFAVYSAIKALRAGEPTLFAHVPKGVWSDAITAAYLNLTFEKVHKILLRKRKQKLPCGTGLEARSLFPVDFAKLRSFIAQHAKSLDGGL